MFIAIKASGTGDAILYLRVTPLPLPRRHTTFFFLAFLPLLLKPISLISPLIRWRFHGPNSKPTLLHFHIPYCPDDQRCFGRTAGLVHTSAELWL